MAVVLILKLQRVIRLQRGKNYDKFYLCHLHFKLCICWDKTSQLHSYNFCISSEILAVQGTLKSLLQHHSSKESILLHSGFFIVQLSHPYMTGKNIALTRQIFVRKVTALLFNMLSRLVITFLPRSKHLLISWLQSPSAVILDFWPCGL